jgi:toxin CptA
MTSAPAIGFEYRPSRLLPRALVVVAMLAALAVMLSALQLWLKPLLLLVVLVATWRAIRRLVTNPIAAAGWSADNAWTLRLLDQEDIPATLASFRVLGALVWLRLQTVERGVQVLLLAPDNSDADIRRRLRMRLATMQPDEALPRL